VRKELKAYGHGLDRKPEVLALNKIDALQEDELEAKRAKLEKAARKKVMIVSGAAGMNVPEVLRQLLKNVDAAKAKRTRAVR
jgi:GTP-binding protein